VAPQVIACGAAVLWGGFLCEDFSVDDLGLYRALQEGRATPADIEELTEALEGAHPGLRLPYLGHLWGLFLRGEHRAQVLRCLLGSTGIEAIRGAERALGDADEEVARVALDFFRKVAETQPHRWVHAVFHPDARVRLATLEDGTPAEAAAMSFFLVADEGCRERALDRFVRGEPRWAMPPAVLPALLAFVDQGTLSRAQGQRLLSALTPEALKHLMDQGLRRRGEVIDAWFKATALATTAARGWEPGLITDETDDLDRLLDLLWEPEPGAEAAEHRSFLARLVAWHGSLPAGEQARIGAALVRKLALEGGALPHVLEAIAEIHPHALAFAWLDRSTRRGMLRVYLEKGHGGRKLSPEELLHLIESDLPSHPDGGLDLWALAAILSRSATPPISTLIGWVSVEKVLDAFARRPQESSPLFSLQDSSHRGTAFLLEKLRQAMPEKLSTTLALWALTAPVQELYLLGIKPRAVKSKKARKYLKKKALLSGADADAARKAAEPEPPCPISAEEAIALYQELQQAELQGRVITHERAERLAQVLAPCLLYPPQNFTRFLQAWLTSTPEPPPLGMEFFVYFSRNIEPENFALWCGKLPEERLLPLLEAISHCTTFPFARERVMAERLVRHGSEAVRAWAHRRLPAEEPKGPPVSLEGEPLDDAQVEALATAEEAHLERLLRELGPRRTRVVEALARRTAAPSPAALVALLGCEDPVADVDREFARFISEAEGFPARVQALAVDLLNSRPALPLLGHAWLMLWERHAFALLQRLVNEGGTLAAGLAPYLAVLRDPQLKARLLEAVASAVGLLSYRDRDRLEAVCTPALLDLFARELAGPAGFGAAEALVFCQRNLRSGPLAERLVELRSEVNAALPELAMKVRERLAPWISSEGLPPPVERPVVEERPAFQLASVQRSHDLDELESWCETAPFSVVEEAALRLSELGEPARLRCVRVLRKTTERRRAEILAELIDLWPEGEALDAVASLVAGEGPGDVRFVLALALLRRRAPGAFQQALRAACSARPASWFQIDDFRQLRRWAPEQGKLCLALARSPQPHAYREAVEWLLAATEPAVADDVNAGLIAFLEAGSERLRSLRTRAAQRLHQGGAWQAIPVLLQAVAQGHMEVPDLLRHGDAALCAGVTRSLLLTGDGAHEQMGLRLLQEAPEEVREEALSVLIEQCRDDNVRRAAVRMLRERPHRAWKLATLGETFAWGVRKGRELLGGVYQVEMIEGNELGYTRLNERRIFVSPLPILRRERRGRELVEALIFHELGHHRYHRGSLAERCWGTARSEGIQGLFNLVLDEHLERNLRAIEEEAGDRLKLLASYAFQHASRSVKVEQLLAMTGERAALVLPRSRLRVARDPGSVVIESGPLLQGMEREGMSFSRFVRALRMGLGNRHGDPKVEQGLALFRDGFRHRSASALLDITRELKRIFGHEACAVECFGSHESLTGDPSEAIEHGDAISSEEVAEEVERVLNPKKGVRPSSAEEGPVKKLWINVNPDEEFDRITSVTKLVYAHDQATRLAAQVRRQAFHLRRYLENLGLTRVPERRRLQGHRFDPTRAQAMVLRNDPRVLIARRLEPRADVHLSILVDCSGSMACGGRIERARLFAALIAEAVRGLQGIEAQVLGFTDQVIYDAGSAEQCAAHALEAGGGNNDAAALWFAALRALRSMRRAQVLVMISDGLPTECSVAALRALVARLSRRRLVCAQVAVAPITEACFPHHVLLDDASSDAAVRRFGALIGTLVRRSISLLIPPQNPMGNKIPSDELNPGQVCEATFWVNPVEGSGFRFRATHLDGKRAPKVVLCDDPRVRPGIPCLVRIASIQKPDRDDRGAILVDFVRAQEFKLEGVYLDPMVARKLQVLLESGLNILLDGPQGCGKTVLARTIARALGFEFVFFNCGAVVEPSDFLATIQVRASATGAPVTDFLKTDFLAALEDASEHPQRRYLIFLDEFNRCQESARNALMPALDSTRKIFHPIRNQFLLIPDNVQFIAAVNRGREFSATFGIDAAQLDRFAPLQMTYPPPDEEVKLLHGRHPELTRSLIETVVMVADAIRRSTELSATLSVRATEEACIYLKHPLFESAQRRMLKEVLKSSFCGRFSGSPDDVGTDAGAVWSLVQRTLRDLQGGARDASAIDGAES
jgi:nitric oxide reductase NorQ protein